MNVLKSFVMDAFGTSLSFLFHLLFQRGWTNQFFMYDPAENQWSRPPCSVSLYMDL